MKIFKSIKWRLQLWYGLILVLILAGFGTTAYQLERNQQFRQLDDEIHRRIGALAQSLHHPHRGPEDQPPPGAFPGDFPPDQNPSPAPFKLTPEMAALFDVTDPNGFFFILRGRDGEEISRSDNTPENRDTARDNTFFDEASHNHNGPPVAQSLPENHGDKRVLVQELPSGEQILVGCSLAPEWRDLNTVTLTLAGGWWFVGRALRPISQISSAAAVIASGDLSQRIDVAEAESELGRLAMVLNSTFARLETAFAQQKQFASDAAHELRTPVTVILTQTQIALARERDAASYQETIRACQRAAQRMRRLIQSLLELARFDAGQEPLKRQRFDFSRTISEVVELVEPLAETRGVKIIFEPVPLPLTGDTERLAQVVTNLLTNAIQYNVPDGRVTVSLSNQDGLAVLSIADTGQGIPKEDLPRVFERFYRADQSRTGAGNAGLGLAICQAIVAAHGGTIEAASEEGTGTTFIIRLPLVGPETTLVEKR
jgi:heavy metal sensor kinase